MAKLIDGKELTRRLREEIRLETQQLKEQGIAPALAVVTVGGDPASAIYVQSKQNACRKAGILAECISLPDTTTQGELLALICELNQRRDIHGILVDLPLPQGINPRRVAETILPAKDVDVFHPENMGQLFLGVSRFAPCTPAGILEMLKDAGVEIAGKNCVVVGTSNIVGKPMAILLLAERGTVTMCNLNTQFLEEKTRAADILVVAIGDPRFIGKRHVKPGAVVVDVGINRLADGTICGDVDFDEVAPLCSAITPAPGGVGPMTVTMLMRNTLEAAKRQNAERMA